MNLSNLKQTILNIFSKINWKVILVVVAVIIVGELIWASWQVRNPLSGNQTPTNEADQSSSLPYLFLETINKTVKVGQILTVDILESSIQPTDGTDVVVNFDPQYLEVVTADMTKVVATSNLYEAYPLNQLREKEGKILVSGVTSKKDGVIAKGVLGTITFKAKMAGQTTIAIDFQKGSTTDSNIIENKESRDILERANSLTININ